MANNKILVIDDEQEFLNTFPEFFIQKGIDIDAFLNTQDFYIKTQARDLSQYKVVFIDYLLPEETGLSFVDKFARTEKFPPVYLMSGDPLVEGNVTNRPDLVFLKKPFELEKIWDEELQLIF
jgi:DNA-binding NtrC family response regulator